MSGKPEPKDLEAVLARLETEWQELAALLKSQAQPQPPPPEGPEVEPLRERLEQLERRQRRLRVFGALMLGLALVLLATQVFLLDRFYWRPGPLTVESLTVRDRQGSLRAWLGEQNGRVLLNLRDRQGKRRAGLGLGPDGSPDLTFYDQSRPRAELKLGAQGEPQFNLYAKLQKLGRTETNACGDTANQATRTGVCTGSEEGTAASPPAPPAQEEAVAGPDAGAVFVGSRTSNKYHYPTCRWVKEITPEKLMKFKSVQDAREHQHYVACPACRPPRADKIESARGLGPKP